MISNTRWQTNTIDWEYVDGTDAKTVYNHEFEDNNSFYESPIGLIYVTDYLYAATPVAWSLSPGYVISDRESDYFNILNTAHNWMYMGGYDWTITQCTSLIFSKYHSACDIDDDGSVDFDFTDDYNAIRPVFYLNSDVLYESGIGTKTDPIILKI